jgi:hypothetical protein
MKIDAFIKKDSMFSQEINVPLIDIFNYNYAFQVLSPGGSLVRHIKLITYNYLYEQITGNL